VNVSRVPVRRILSSSDKLANIAAASADVIGRNIIRSPFSVGFSSMTNLSNVIADATRTIPEEGKLNNHLSVYWNNSDFVAAKDKILYK
jgi:hypothetical protein